MKTKTLPLGWLDRAAAAACFGVTVRAFDMRLRKLLPADAVRVNKGRVSIHMSAAIAAHVAHEVASATSSRGGLDDPLMAGGDSVTLERYRNARASLTELELAERRGEVLRVAVIQPGMQMGMNVLRQMGERLERLYGAEAGKMFNEAIEESCAMIEKSFADVSPEGEGDAKVGEAKS